MTIKFSILEERTCLTMLAQKNPPIRFHLNQREHQRDSRNQAVNKPSVLYVISMYMCTLSLHISSNLFTHWTLITGTPCEECKDCVLPVWSGSALCVCLWMMCVQIFFWLHAPACFSQRLCGGIGKLSVRTHSSFTELDATLPLTPSCRDIWGRLTQLEKVKHVIHSLKLTFKSFCYRRGFPVVL